MCLAAPAQIQKIDWEEKIAIVDYFGTQRTISIYLVPKVQIGDWVLIHAGEAIQILDEEEAQDTISLWKEVYNAASME